MNTKYKLKGTVEKHFKGFAFIIPERTVVISDRQGQQQGKQGNNNDEGHDRKRGRKSSKRGGRHARNLEGQFEPRAPEKDIFLPADQATRLFHGDRVEFTYEEGRSKNQRGNRRGQSGQTRDLRVIEHRFKELVGRYTSHPAREGGWVIYERKQVREEVFVPRDTKGCRSEDWVRVKLQFHLKGPFPVTAEILEIYGPVLPPSADIPLVASECNLTEKHSDEAEREAKQLPLELSDADTKGRDDLTGIPFITIDGETARDFDDAVFVERKKGGGYLLWVAIADVSHYVTPASALDKEARSRGTSVYFPERAFHMLPRALSENLCSLRPEVTRLALVAVIEFNEAGRRVRTEIKEAIIKSKRRATYTEIGSEHSQWLANGKNPAWEFVPHFELFDQLRRERLERGSIDFELSEAEILAKPSGEIVSIKKATRLISHRLIEEFMIAANEAVTEWMIGKSWPFIYRVHAEPAFEPLKKFQALAKTVGVDFQMKGGSSPRAIAELLRKLDGHPSQTLLNMALLRSLKQAIYSSQYGTHFGLASKGYTHFTSPIRRYPDLVVHRLIRQALHVVRVMSARNKNKAGHLPSKALEKDLAEICEHCSYRERLATEAERASLRLKQVRLMMPRLGEDFSGQIVGMTENGFFVQLSDPYVEGLVHRESMTDDYYEFNEERMIFSGRRKRKIFKIGDKVNVKLIRSDLDQRQIDFALTPI